MSLPLTEFLRLERFNGIEEVMSSSLICSTKKRLGNRYREVFILIKMIRLTA